MTGRRDTNIGFLFILVMAQSGCYYTGDSTTADQALYGSTTNTPSGGAQTSPYFGQFRQVLAANCIQCHAVWLNYSEAQFVSEQLVVPGSANTSLLFRKLKQNNGDMPANDTTISDADYATIQNWINTIPASGS